MPSTGVRRLGLAARAAAPRRDRAGARGRRQQLTAGPRQADRALRPVQQPRLGDPLQIDDRAAQRGLARAPDARRPARSAVRRRPRRRHAGVGARSRSSRGRRSVKGDGADPALQRDFTGVNSRNSPLPATSVAACSSRSPTASGSAATASCSPRRCGLDPGVLRAAGWLHDVGMAAITLPAGGLGPDDRRALETHPALGHGCWPAPATSGSTRRRRSPGRTTSASTAPATRAGSPAPRSRSPGASPPWPTRSTRSPPTGRTAPRCRSSRRWRRCGASAATNSTRRSSTPCSARSSEALAILARFPPEPVVRREGTLLTLQAAADRLSISPARLRRLADAGRIEAVRTAGGHRRFRPADVLRLAAEVDGRPRVRPLAASGQPLPALATTLRQHGRALAAAAGAALYREGPPGWFASDAAAPTAPRLAGDAGGVLRQRALRARAHRVGGAAGAGEPSSAPPCSSGTRSWRASGNSPRARSCAAARTPPSWRGRGGW